MKKVIDRGKRSKTLSEVKPVKNISKYPCNQGHGCYICIYIYFCFIYISHFLLGKGL